MSLALVLSGGGARGAYEVGVLSYLFDDLVRSEGPIGVDVICGTSVGAVNGAFLASVIDDPVPGLRRLDALWRGLELSDVLGFGVTQARRLHRVLLGGRRGGGLFDAGPMTRIIADGIDWRQLARNLRSGRLSALTITATHVPSGRPTCFVDRAPGVQTPTGLPRQIAVRRTRILPHHVLASAAIPLVFPPVFIRSELYCDGGLRLNTPLSPAIHLGARKVLVIGMSTEAESRPELAASRFPGLGFLLGKVLDAFLLDHVNFDLEELERVNAMLRDGEAAFGPEFLARTNEEAVRRGGPPRALVDALAIRPSQDIGALAADFLRRERVWLRRKLGKALLRAVDVGEGADTSDLASYLLFDGAFASELIALGRRDAAARRDEVLEFLRRPTP